MHVCIIPVIGKCMVWVGQVKFGRLFSWILLNIENSPSKCLLQEANVFPKSGKLTPHYDKNTSKSAFVKSALTWHHF